MRYQLLVTDRIIFSLQTTGRQDAAAIRKGQPSWQQRQSPCVRGYLLLELLDLRVEVDHPSQLHVHLIQRQAPVAGADVKKQCGKYCNAVSVPRTPCMHELNAQRR